MSSFRAQSHEELAAFLTQHVLPSERRYKPPAPDDLISGLLSNFAQDLEIVYRSQESNPGVQTKIALWRDSLQGAGIVPPDNEPSGQASLFVRHTVLVVAARILKRLLQDGDASKSSLLIDYVSDGFPAWLAESSESEDVVKRIATRLEEYEWRGHTRDRLKDAYQQLIARDERKEFGEYYTPDWLASKVVNETLDEPWMDRAVKAAASTAKRPVSLEGVTVLDPACGSGTFLFHAARRLLQHIQLRHPRKLRRARRIITQSVVGIDVHPIAVEMAEATLEMALPPPDPDDRSPSQPQVFLGDAMQSTRRDDLSRDVIFTESAKGTRLTFPTALAVHRDAHHLLIPRLCDAARNEQDATFPELAGPDRVGVSRTLATLTAIIREESDHVWTWHLRNIAGPCRMGRSKAGRIVTNPPWLMENDTTDGYRKERIAALREEYGLRNRELRRRRASTTVDLAAVFTARVADLYLASDGKMGLVLPGGVLINQNWDPWRSGCWHSEQPGCHVNLTHAWGMDDLEPPPFPHAPSGSCVVFADRLDQTRFDQEKTRLHDAEVGIWSGSLASPTIKPKRSFSRRPSEYESEWDRGVMAEPQALICVLESAVESLKDRRLVKIVTKQSTKMP